MFQSKKIALFAALLASTASFAVDGGSSGAGKGGQGVNRPDGTIISADHFADDQSKEPIGDRYTLPPEVQAELRRMGKILVRYQADIDQPTKVIYSDLMTGSVTWPDLIAKSDFVEKSILNDSNEYRIVNSIKEVSTACDPLALNPLPPGFRSHDLMCTIGNVTYIERRALPENRQMSVRDFAGHLVHERAHTLEINSQHFYLAHLNVGLTLALEIEDRQAKGDRTFLDETALTKLEKLLVAVQALRLGEARLPALKDGEKRSTAERILFRVHPYGGGTFHRSTIVAPSAFLGVNSTLGAGSYALEEAQILNTHCDAYSIRTQSEFKFLSWLDKKGDNKPSLSGKSSSKCAIGRRAKVENLIVFGGDPIPSRDFALNLLYNLNHGVPNSRYEAESKAIIEIQEDAQVKNATLSCGQYSEGINRGTSNFSATYTFEAGSNSEGIALQAADLSVGKFTKINGLKGINSANLRVGQNSILANVEVNYASMSVGENSRVNDSEIYATDAVFGSGVILEKFVSNIQLNHLEIGDRVSLKQLTLEGTSKHGVAWVFPYIESDSRLRFKPNSTISANGSPVCAQGAKLRVKGSETVANLEELKKLCAKVRK